MTNPLESAVGNKISQHMRSPDTTVAVRRRGVRVFEGTPVTEISPGRLLTTRGTVRARYVIRATEGYTPGLPGLHRAIAPVYSLMIATEPLPESVWDQIGLASRPTFGDYRHLIG